jgi:hypothetical protein
MNPKYIMTAPQPKKDNSNLNGFFQEKDVDRQIVMVQQEIASNDKKLMEKLLRLSKDKTALMPIANEIEQFGKLLQKSRKHTPTKNGDRTRDRSPNQEDETAKNMAMTNLHNTMDHDIMTLLTPRDQPRTTESSNNSMNDMKVVLKKIFIFYASFGDRTNATHLKANKLYKMMQDALVIDNKVDKKKIDLLFCKENKNKPNVNFDTFLSLLVAIGHAKYPDLNDKDGFLVLFRKNLFPLFTNLYQKTDLGEKDIKFKEGLEDVIVMMMEAISPTFGKLHQIYFPPEYQIMSNAKIARQKIEHCLVVFLKDFDICPSLINKTVAFSLFHELLDTPLGKITHNPKFQDQYFVDDKGNDFTLSRFLVYVARISMLNSDKLPNKDRFLGLLERMQLSLGFIAFETKMNSTNNSGATFMPPKAFLRKYFSEKYGADDSRLMTTGESYRSNRSKSPGLNSVRRSLNISSFSGQQNMSAMTPKKFSLTPKPYNQPSALNMSAYSAKGVGINKVVLRHLDLKPDCIAVLEKNKEVLLRIFRAYSSFCGSTTTYKMKCVKLIKLLKHAQLLAETDISKDELILSGAKSAKSFREKSVDKLLKSPNMNTPRNKTMLKAVDLDLLFVKLTSYQAFKLTRDSTEDLLNTSPPGPRIQKYHNLQGKLEFEHFLKALEIISGRLYPDLEDDVALQKIIDINLNQITPERNGALELVDTKLAHVKKLMDLLKNADVVDVIGKLKKSLHPYYAFYCDAASQITFEQFLKFCKDFEIFPKILARSKLMLLFYNLATLHPLINSNSKNRKGLTESARGLLESIDNEVIDENLFTEAIALCALEVDENTDVHPIEKINYLLERMADSNGHEIILKTHRMKMPKPTLTFEVLTYIRNKYPDIVHGRNKSANTSMASRSKKDVTNVSKFESLFNANP